jgi:uncharacterized protein (DUF362 family)
MDEKSVVAYTTNEAVYSQIAPFHPHTAYPETLFSEVSEEPNAAYDCVRACFHLAGLDREHYNTPQWNPLGDLLRPGETVLLKPNFVKESHPRDPKGWQYVLTHGSIIRAVADYVWKALAGQGKIIIADAPQTDSSFSAIVHRLGLDAIQNFYRTQGLDLELIDLRREEWTNRDGVIVNRRLLPDNAYGNIAFNLGEASEFVGHQGAGHYYGADYDERQVNSHHTGGRHEYLIAGCAIKCDVVFSLPKLKTHKKAGITVSLKNLVGVNGDKNWLPHHTEGHPTQGGDEHPNPDTKHQAERRLAASLRRISLKMPTLGTMLHRYARRVGTHIFGDTEQVIRSGNWHGNDTVWRMCLDLNKLILYGNVDGSMREALPQHRKRHYVLVDAIIAGEGSGPMNPDPLPAGLIVFGLHPASVDAACAYLMGFDPERIPIVRQAFCCRHYRLTEWDWRDVKIISNRVEWNYGLPQIASKSTLHFKPHFGWRGHIERDDNNGALA